MRAPWVLKQCPHQRRVDEQLRESVGNYLLSWSPTKSMHQCVAHIARVTACTAALMYIKTRQWPFGDLGRRTPACRRRVKYPPSYLHARACHLTRHLTRHNYTVPVPGIHRKTGCDAKQLAGAYYWQEAALTSSQQATSVRCEQERWRPLPRRLLLGLLCYCLELLYIHSYNQLGNRCVNMSLSRIMRVHLSF